MLTSVNQWRLLGQIVLGLGLTALFLYTMAPFLIALAMGAVVAILCQPVHRRLTRLLPPVLSAIVVTGGITLLILVPLTFLGIGVVYQLRDLLHDLKIPSLSDLQNLTEHPKVIQFVHQIPTWIPVDRAWVQEQSLSLLQTILEKASQLLASVVGQLPGILLGVSIVIISSFFFILDGVKFASFLEKISPLPAEKSQQLFNAFSDTCRGVVLSMLAGALAQGILVAIFFAATQVPNAVLWGFIGVILGLIPLVGTTPLIVGGILFHLGNHHVGGAIAILIAGVAVGFADNLIRPWVLKGHGEMHPLLGLVSAFGAVSVLGPVGIILGPLIAAVFVAFLEILSSDLRSV